MKGSTWNQYAKMGDLPDAMKPLVHKAQECIKQHIALKTSWTMDPPVGGTRLPSTLDLIIAATQDACNAKDNEGQPIPAIEAGYHMLLDNNNPQAQNLRASVKSLVSGLGY